MSLDLVEEKHIEVALQRTFLDSVFFVSFSGTQGQNHSYWDMQMLHVTHKYDISKMLFIF